MLSAYIQSYIYLEIIKKNILKNLHLISDANCITTMVERNGNRTPKLGSLNQVIINIQGGFFLLFRPKNE